MTFEEDLHKEVKDVPETKTKRPGFVLPENLHKEDITKKDFPLIRAHEEELIAKFSAEDGKKLLINEMEFNRELQIFVMNLMKKRKLTLNYIIGCLTKLSWGLMQDDFVAQMKEIAKLHEGGR